MQHDVLERQLPVRHSACNTFGQWRNALPITHILRLQHIPVHVRSQRDIVSEVVLCNSVCSIFITHQGRFASAAQGTNVESIMNYSIGVYTHISDCLWMTPLKIRWTDLRFPPLKVSFASLFLSSTFRHPMLPILNKFIYNVIGKNEVASIVTDSPKKYFHLNK